MPLRGATRDENNRSPLEKGGGLQGGKDRGRKSRFISAPPPSEPDRRISRIRLSSWWFYLKQD